MFWTVSCLLLLYEPAPHRNFTLPCLDASSHDNFHANHEATLVASTEFASASACVVSSLAWGTAWYAQSTPQIKESHCRVEYLVGVAIASLVDDQSLVGGGFWCFDSSPTHRNIHVSHEIIRQLL